MLFIHSLFLQCFLVQSHFLHKIHSLKHNHSNHTISVRYKHTRKYYKHMFRNMIGKFRQIKENIRESTKLVYLMRKQHNSWNNIKINGTLKSLELLQKSFNRSSQRFKEFIKTDYQIMNKFKRKRKKNINIFYNSISMVMLSMLVGGLIGLLFVMYYISRDK